MYIYLCIESYSSCPVVYLCFALEGREVGGMKVKWGCGGRNSKAIPITGHEGI
jgi:hypothetical protein